MPHIFLIGLKLVDQYDNETKTPVCVDHLTVDAEGLDKSAIKFIWQVRTNLKMTKVNNDNKI